MRFGTTCFSCLYNAALWWTVIIRTWISENLHQHNALSRCITKSVIIKIPSCIFLFHSYTQKKWHTKHVIAVTEAAFLPSYEKNRTKTVLLRTGGHSRSLIKVTSLTITCLRDTLLMRHRRRNMFLSTYISMEVETDLCITSFCSIPSK